MMSKAMGTKDSRLDCCSCCLVPLTGIPVFVALPLG
jgi:hypothetical protein